MLIRFLYFQMAYAVQNGVEGVADNEVIFRVHRYGPHPEMFPNIYNTLGVHLCCIDCHPVCLNDCPEQYSEHIRGHGTDYHLVDHVLTHHHAFDTIF